MIKIITIGTIKEKYLKDAIAEYQKRLQKYTNLEMIELKDEGLVEIDKALHLEGEKIKKHLTDRDYIVTLEIEGEQLNSVEFSKKLEKIQLESSNIVFIIGGSYGLSSEIKAKAKLHLSVSKMTFPHQLFRVILLEQIYRAYKIINNESYHK